MEGSYPLFLHTVIHSGHVERECGFGSFFGNSNYYKPVMVEQIDFPIDDDLLYGRLYVSRGGLVVTT